MTWARNAKIVEHLCILEVATKRSLAGSVAWKGASSALQTLMAFARNVPARNHRKMGSRLDAECPYCGLRYKRLRTGLDYRAVFEMLWSYNDDPATWRHKRRNTVLGKWHQIKMSIWDQHLFMCETEHAADEERAAIKAEEKLLDIRVKGVPF